MFLKRKKYKNLDFVNNTTTKTQMLKHEATPKIQTIIDTIKPKSEIIKPQFKKPTTDEGWKQFHKTNEEGMKKAYDSTEGYYKQDNKLYIAGTKDLHDVYDWAKIPLGTFNESKIYKNIDKVYRDDSRIDYVVGHSAGGSAALELEKQYPNRKITSITYSSPVFSPFDYNQFKNSDEQSLRFNHPGDIVSNFFDMNATSVWKAPTFNFDLIKDVANVVAEPSIPNIMNVKNSITDTKNFDPLSVHTMENSYSQPSEPVDFLKSAVQATVIGLGI
jgi:hypothetical protein